MGTVDSVEEAVHIDVPLRVEESALIMLGHLTRRTVGQTWKSRREYGSETLEIWTYMVLAPQ
jgi:hypothetical protein